MHTEPHLFVPSYVPSQVHVDYDYCEGYSPLSL